MQSLFEYVRGTQLLVAGFTILPLFERLIGLFLDGIVWGIYRRAIVCKLKPTMIIISAGVRGDNSWEKHLHDFEETARQISPQFEPSKFEAAQVRPMLRDPETRATFN